MRIGDRSSQSCIDLGIWSAQEFHQWCRLCRAEPRIWDAQRFLVVRNGLLVRTAWGEVSVRVWSTFAVLRRLVLLSWVLLCGGSTTTSSWQLSHLATDLGRDIENALLRLSVEQFFRMHSWQYVLPRCCPTRVMTTTALNGSAMFTATTTTISPQVIRWLGHSAIGNNGTILFKSKRCREPSFDFICFRYVETDPRWLLRLVHWSIFHLHSGYWVHWFLLRCSGLAASCR